MGPVHQDITRGNIVFYDQSEPETGQFLAVSYLDWIGTPSSSTSYQ